MLDADALRKAVARVAVAKLDARKASLRARLHIHQQRVFDSKARWKAVLCSRRAGKTVLDAALLVDAATEAGADEHCVYIARDRKLAKSLIWGKLKQLIRELGLIEDGWKIKEAELRIELPNGAAIALYGARGADHDETMNALRGLKIRRCIYDEPSTYTETLEAMTRDVVEPALGDVRGDLIVTGTPGVVLAGWWFEVSTGKGANPRKKWERHKWTVLDNPFFADPQKWLDDQLRENQWTPDNPTYIREYLGEWFADDNDLVYRYLASRNKIGELPKDYSRDWAHTLGVDFGTMRDSCAWTVLASHPHRRDIYVVKSFKRHGMLPEQAAEITNKLIREYNVDRTAADSGGLGAPYVAEYAKRFGTQLTAADKRDKRGHIDLLNGDLRAPRVFVLDTECQELIAEIEVLPYANDKREKEHASYANDCADSFLYAYVAHRAYLHERPEPKPDPRRKWDDEAQIEAEAAELLSEAGAAWWDR